MLYGRGIRGVDSVYRLVSQTLPRKRGVINKPVVGGYVGDSSGALADFVEADVVRGGRTAGRGDNSVGVSEREGRGCGSSSSSSSCCGIAGRDLSKANIGDGALLPPPAAAACRADFCFFFRRAIRDS